MGNAGGQLPHRCQPIRPPELLLYLLPFGEVLKDGHGPQEPFLPIPERGVGDADGKDRPVHPREGGLEGLCTSRTLFPGREGLEAGELVQAQLSVR